MEQEQIAKVCHEANRALCESNGDFSQPTWDNAPDWQKTSAINGVNAHIEKGLTPEQSHENWMKEKEENGWVYGETKDPEAKTHPCMVPYSELPADQKTKDYVFKAIVETLKEMQ